MHKLLDIENQAYPDSPVRWFVLNVEANVEIDITAADGLRELAVSSGTAASTWAWPA